MSSTLEQNFVVCVVPRSSLDVYAKAGTCLYVVLQAFPAAFKGMQPLDPLLLSLAVE